MHMINLLAGKLYRLHGLLEIFPKGKITYVESFPVMGSVSLAWRGTNFSPFPEPGTAHPSSSQWANSRCLWVPGTQSCRSGLDRHILLGNNRFSRSVPFSRPADESTLQTQERPLFLHDIVKLMTEEIFPYYLRRFHPLEIIRERDPGRLELFWRWQLFYLPETCPQGSLSVQAWKPDDFIC